MGDFVLTVVIVGVWALGILLFIGLCLFLPSIIRSFLGTDSRPHGRSARENATWDAEYQALQEEIDQQREQVRTLSDTMDEMLAKQARTPRKQRGRKTPQAPIDVTQMPERPLATLRGRETRMHRKRD